MADITGIGQDGSGLRLKWHDNGDGTFSPVVFDANAGAGGASGGTPALTLGTANAAGVAATFIRDDDTILVFDATVPTTSAPGDAAATGNTATAARRNHVHGRSTATRSIWLSARGGFILDAGTQGTPGTLPDQMATISLADAATQGLVWAGMLVPRDAVAAQPLNMVIYWGPGSSDATAHTVRWSVDVIRLVAGSDVTAAGTTTAFTGSSAARTLNQAVIEPAQQALAAVTAGDVIRLDLRRIGADAADTYVGTVQLLGVELQYTANV